MKRKYKALKNFVFFEFIIKTIMESYSNIAVCSFISLYYVRFDTPGEAIQTIYGFVFDIILLAFPFTLLVAKVRWSDVILDTAKEGKFSGFYKDVSLRKGPRVLMWTFYFLFRRFALACVMVVASETLIYQVFVMAFQIVFAVILMGWAEPFDTLFQKRLELANEVNLMFIMYTIICFSPLVPSYERK